jgi:hypothetical protein
MINRVTAFFLIEYIHCFKKYQELGCYWLTPLILATKEAEIRRIKVQCWPQGSSSPGDPISQKLST